MLSILIPTHNFPIYDLVKSLHKQCEENQIIFEIITLDDGSKSEYNSTNEKINSLSNCSFFALEKNVGHSAIRNKLVSKSRHENLLFIDGDSKIITSNYILTYLNELNTADVIFGGRVHPENYPNENCILRWRYGRLVEDKTANKRKLNSYKTLMFNNTIFKKSKFENLQFDESLKQYGHEDTLLAYQISKTNLIVKHIDNPIQHNDIDTNTMFLVKTRKGLENLLKLYESRKINSDFIAILKLYHSIRKLHLKVIIQFIYNIFHKKIIHNLESSNPSLFLFNVYKIGYLCSAKSRNK